LEERAAKIAWDGGASSMILLRRLRLHWATESLTSVSCLMRPEPGAEVDPEQHSRRHGPGRHLVAFPSGFERRAPVACTPRYPRQSCGRATRQLIGREFHQHLFEKLALAAMGHASMWLRKNASMAVLCSSAIESDIRRISSWPSGAKFQASVAFRSTYSRFGIPMTAALTGRDME